MQLKFFCSQNNLSSSSGIPHNLVDPPSLFFVTKLCVFKVWYGGFLKWWYPTTIGFPTKNDHFGVFGGYHHLRKHLNDTFFSVFFFKMASTHGTFYTPMRDGRLSPSFVFFVVVFFRPRRRRNSSLSDDIVFFRVGNEMTRLEICSVWGVFFRWFDSWLMIQLCKSGEVIN